MTTATLSLPAARRKARVRDVPGAALPLPSALPHPPCTHYKATYSHQTITVHNQRQAEALWYNGYFGHGGIAGGNGRPRKRKKWKLVEADGLKNGKWFKEAQQQRTRAEGRVEGIEQEIQEGEEDNVTEMEDLSGKEDEEEEEEDKEDLNEGKEEEEEEEEEDNVTEMKDLSEGKEEEKKEKDKGHFNERKDEEEEDKEKNKEDLSEGKEEEDKEDLNEGKEEEEDNENDKETKDSGVEKMEEGDREKTTIKKENKENETEGETQNMDTKQMQQENATSQQKQEEEETDKNRDNTPNTNSQTKPEQMSESDDTDEEFSNTEEETEIASYPGKPEPWRTVLVLSPDQKGATETHHPHTYLTLLPEEALFLSYALGCLVCTHGDPERRHSRKRALEEQDTHEMTIDEMWRVFTQDDPMFAVKYAVYHHYRTLGWVVKAGLKYGVDYVLYPVGPPFYHSQYAVKVHSVWADTLTLDHSLPGHSITWTTTATTERLANHVNKTPVICLVLRPRSVSQLHLRLIECLKELKVQEMVLTRWNPSDGTG